MWPFDNLLSRWAGNGWEKGVTFLIDRMSYIVNINSTAGAYDDTALMRAAENGNTKIVEALLDRGAELNFHDADGVTALVLAAEKGHNKTVEALLNRGAELDFHGVNGVTALVFAAKNGNTQIVEAFLEKGADVNAVNLFGITALMYAADNGNTKIVEALLKKGADVNAVTSFGITALMYAAKKGHNEIVEALLEKGADVNAVNKDGVTALMYAAKNGNTKIVEAFLEKGADVNAVNKDGDNVLHLAIKSNHFDLIPFLLENGAQADYMNNNGKRPLDCLAEEQRQKIESKYNDYIQASEYCDSLLSDNPKSDSEVMQNSENVTEVVKKILKKRLINNDGLEAFTSRFGEDRPYISSILTDEFKAEVRQEVAKNRAAKEMRETLSKGGEYNRNLSDLSEDTQNYIVEEFKKICIKKGVPSYESVNRMIASDKFPDHMRNEITKFVENSKEQFEVIEAAVMYNLNPENSIVPDFLAERTMQYSNSRNERKRSSITTLEAGDLYEKLSIDSIKELQRLDEFILPEDAKMKLQELKPHLIENVRQHEQAEREGEGAEPVPTSYNKTSTEKLEQDAKAIASDVVGIINVSTPHVASGNQLPLIKSRSGGEVKK